MIHIISVKIKKAIEKYKNIFILLARDMHARYHANPKRKKAFVMQAMPLHVHMGGSMCSTYLYSGVMRSVMVAANPGVVE
jgi:hypothetical protein